MGFKAYVLLKGEPPASNALVFATEHEADEYGKDLLSRWWVPIGHEVRQVDEAPNYEWVDGKGLRRLGSDSDSEPHMPPAQVRL